MKTIGILGGGQLAKMTLMQAKRMGLDVAILDHDPDAPACQMTPLQHKGRLDDPEALKAFAAACDCITLENEFLDHNLLCKIEDEGTPVIPPPHTIKLIQDKLTQKHTLKAHDIAVSAFTKIEEGDDYASIRTRIGTSFVLKARTMSYDGYGNHLVGHEEDFKQGLAKLKDRSHGLMAEAYVDFDKELAVIIARSKSEHVIYPTVETIQKHHRCSEVIMPADIDATTSKKAGEMALRAVEAIKGIGVFGVELFLRKDGTLLVNEIAPRPHNSGHYTIEACETSQFENHVRAVMGWPLGASTPLHTHAIMINILASDNEVHEVDYPKLLAIPGAFVHDYAKRVAQPGRKMGHVTIVSECIEDVNERAHQVKKHLP